MLRITLNVLGDTKIIEIEGIGVNQIDSTESFMYFGDKAIVNKAYFVSCEFKEEVEQEGK